MKTIIVPTDFSPTANNAMNFAAEMAMNIDASLLLLNVYQVPVSVTDMPVVVVSTDDLKKDSESKLIQSKNELAGFTSGKVKIYTETRMGDVSDELEELCKKVQPFAVIMGTNSTSGVERVLFGSTALRAIRHLTWPVIVVPPDKKYGGGIKKIGFACDFDKVIETTLVQFIRNIVKTFGAELHVLNVDHDNKHFKPKTPEESVMLQTMLEDLNPSYHFIDNVDIEDGINEFAEKNNLDLLITIPKKHSLLDALFKHSSTKELVTHSHVPVMCVHE